MTSQTTEHLLTAQENKTADGDDTPRFEPYDSPAGGWGALQATAKALREQSVIVKGGEALLSMNQPDGFDCRGCAWPDPKHTSSFEFCENGAKAVAFELTSRRVTSDFLAAHTVRELERQSDYWLEEQGRLTEPMRYDASTDRYVPIAWDEAFALIGRELRALESPDQGEFYTSGRTSNEAAFLYQLFVRRFGTNNFPDCSNMCHEPTSVGLPESIGIGKGTVLLEDFAHADAIFIIGQNPGTNSPRMMTELRNASRRGVPIVVLNPLRERALERFAAGVLAMSIVRQDDQWPFYMVVAFFVSAFGTLALSFWPYMIPFVITIEGAAAPQSTLRFMSWGAIIVFPLMLLYTVVGYRVFRGKIADTAAHY